MYIQLPLFEPLHKPDEILWPSDNQYGVPDLLIDGQADGIVEPVALWGQRSRSQYMPGIYLFYVDDYRFQGLWNGRPDKLTDSGCQVITEVNFSVMYRMPFAYALYQIYRKRWLSRYYQEHGIQIIVDVCVATNYLELNLLGVPRGWRWYSTRAYHSATEILPVQYEACKNHADGNEVSFVVYGGRKDSHIARCCEKNGWIHIEDCNARK